MTHWAEQYIGRPWSRTDHNCWTFFRDVQWRQFQRKIPDYGVDAGSSLSSARSVKLNPERANWDLVLKPVEGDAILMAHAKHPSHVGIWVEVDGGGALHCINGAGVVFQSIAVLKASGWGRLEFYHHA